MTRRFATATLALLAVPAGVLAQQQDYPLPSEPAASPGAAEKPPLKPLTPKAALRRAVVIDRVRGTVRFRLPSEERDRRLTGPTTVPMRTVVDATEGRVRLTVARDRSGRTDSGVFFDGRFSVAQGAGKRPLTHLRLVGEFETACTSASASAAAAKKPRRRRLWGDGKGRFRTRGRYSAATVRGTKWLVEDRCDGTLTKVARGEVEVVDFAPPAPPAAPPQQEGAAGGSPSPTVAPVTDQRRTRRIRVRRGGSYVARPGG